MSKLTDADVQRGAEYFEESARRASEAGDPAAAADAYARLAALFTASNHIDDAVKAMNRAVETSRQTGDLDTRSGYLMTLGILLCKGSGGAKRGLEVLRSAAMTAREAGNEARQLQCWRRIVQIHAGREDLRRAVAAQERVIELLSPGTPSAALACAYRDRALFHQLSGHLERAKTDLERGRDIAEAAGDAARMVEIGVQLLGFTKAGDATDRSAAFDALLVDAAALDDPAVLARVQLEAAMAAIRQKNSERGLVLAEAARTSSLQAADPKRYTMACMVIAEAREALGDRAGVIGILLTCKRTLEAQVGPAAGASVKLVLDSLSEKWGREAVSEALETHRQRMRQTAHS